MEKELPTITLENLLKHELDLSHSQDLLLVLNALPRKSINKRKKKKNDSKSRNI
jgi:hypothetical protein